MNIQWLFFIQYSQYFCPNLSLADFMPDFQRDDMRPQEVNKQEGPIMPMLQSVPV